MRTSDAWSQAAPALAFLLRLAAEMLDPVQEPATEAAEPEEGHDEDEDPHMRSRRDWFGDDDGGLVGDDDGGTTVGSVRISERASRMVAR